MKIAGYYLVRFSISDYLLYNHLQHMQFLLLREKENPKVAPFCVVEIFTKPGTNSEAKREMIFIKTDMIPAPKAR
jgi:hypothetical protein